MDEVSIGPEENDDQPVQPGVDAQSETERDIERGLAGAEAKPFSELGEAKISDTEARASESDEADPSPKTQESLVSGRRNSGREKDGLVGALARNAPDIFQNAAHRRNLIRGLAKPQPNIAV